MFQHCKRLLALLIFACVFLPLARCSAPEPPPAGPDRASPTSMAREFIPADNIELKDGTGWLILLLFTWPLGTAPALEWARRQLPQRRRWLLGLNGLEMLCASLLMVYVLEVVDAWGVIRYGGVLTLCAAGLNLGLCLYELRSHWRPPALRPPA